MSSNSQHAQCSETLPASMQRCLEIPPPSMQLGLEILPPSMQQYLDSLPPSSNWRLYLPACNCAWRSHITACSGLSLQALNSHLRGQSKQLQLGAGTLHLCWAPWWHRGTPGPWLPGLALLSLQLPDSPLQEEEGEEVENMGCSEWRELPYRDPEPRRQKILD